MSDRLSLAHAFEDAGIPRDKAEQVATAVLNAIRDNVATKADIGLVRTDIAVFYGRIANVEGSLSAKIDHVEGSLNAKIDRIADRLLLRLGGVIVVVAGALFAALRHWPPHP